MPIKKRAPRRKRLVRRARRSGPSRSLNPSYQVATLVETLDPNISFIQNTPYFQNVQLSQFQRCVAMSALYEQFRIEEVKYVYTPLYNTYQEASAGPATPTVPYVYTLMDRLQSLNPSTTVLADYVLAGAKRQKFDRPITIKYRPNTMVTSGVSAVGAVLVTSIETLQINGADYGRWFPCVTQRVGNGGDNTPNTISAHDQQYQGHHLYFRQDSGVALLAIATVAVSIRVSFKNPMVNNVSAQPAPKPWLPIPGRTVHTERTPILGIGDTVDQVG